MNTTHPSPPDLDGPRRSREQLEDLSLLRRTVGADRKVAGVGGGIARHLDIDPTVVRVVLAVLAVFSGAGLVVYLACWLLVPEDGRDRARIHLQPDSRKLILVLALVVAVLVLLGGVWSVPQGFPAVVLLVGILGYLVLRDQRRGPTAPPAQPGQPGQAVSSGEAGQAGETGRAGRPASATRALGHWEPASRRPRAPRPERGPGLLAPVLGVIVLALVGLGLADLAGVPVPGSAYPALALALTGIGLVVSIRWGRGGGLIALAVLLVPVLALSTAAEQFQSDTATYRPGAVSEVRADYRFDNGARELDLTGLTDPQQLDGRTVRVRGDLGVIRVVVPESVRLETSSDIRFGGDITVDGRLVSGLAPSVSRSVPASPAGTSTADTPTLTLDLDLQAGQIEVIRR